MAFLVLSQPLKIRNISRILMQKWRYEERPTASLVSLCIGWRGVMTREEEEEEEDEEEEEE